MMQVLALSPKWLSMGCHCKLGYSYCQLNSPGPAQGPQLTAAKRSLPAAQAAEASGIVLFAARIMRTERGPQ